jgi:hypothetical protein
MIPAKFSTKTGVKWKLWILSENDAGSRILW